jgi:hypothetical protein
MYSYAETQASRSALLELGLALKNYRDEFVLAGGWAPYFITEGHFEHSGSRDIDLIIRTDREIEQRYKSIRKIIQDIGYTPENDFRFVKDIPCHVDGVLYPIELDLLCDREGAPLIPPFKLRRVQEDLSAYMFYGLNLAFDFNFEQKIEGILPGNGEDKTKIRVADLVGSLALKGRALGRRNPKDAYDIFALTHYNGGALAAAEYFSQAVADKKLATKRRELLEDSVSRITDKFEHEDKSGPYDVWLYSEGSIERNIAAKQVNQFLSNITL